MYKIPQKVSARISQGIKNFQPVLRSALLRDVNLIRLLLLLTFYPKYSDIINIKRLLKSSRLEGHIAI